MDSKNLVDKLDTLLSEGPVNDIYNFERSKEVYLAISKSAENINENGYGEYFACVQGAMVNEMILHASKMFDHSKKYEMRTFPNILSFLDECAEQIPVTVEHYVHLKELAGEEKEFQIRQEGDKCIGNNVWVGLPESPQLDPSCIIKFVENVRAGMPELSKCCKGHELSQNYALLREMRDKEVAHNEHVVDVQRPTLEMAEELILWGKAALEAISRLCIPGMTYYDDGGNYILSTDAGRPRRCLERMLRALKILPPREWAAK